MSTKLNGFLISVVYDILCGQRVAQTDRHRQNNTCSRHSRRAAKCVFRYKKRKAKQVCEVLFSPTDGPGHDSHKRITVLHPTANGTTRPIIVFKFILVFIFFIPSVLNSRG